MVMDNNRITYEAKGRCMKGTNVYKYMLLGTDNKIVATNLTETIHLIGRGMINNLRLVPNDNNMGVSIRGKGVNILKLPVYEEYNGAYRVRNTEELIGKVEKESFAEFKITHRVMYKNDCIAFILMNSAGVSKPIRKKRVMALAAEDKISNATLVRHKNETTGNVSAILRGVSCSLLDLPVIAADENGEAITRLGIPGVTVRAAMMVEAGTVRDDTGKRVSFSPSDILVFNEFGYIDVYKKQDFIRRFRHREDCTEAIVDSISQQAEKYNIDLFNSNTYKLSIKTINKWKIASYV